MAPALPPLRPEPLISVILPVRNESAYIHKALESLQAQDYPADKIEIWVVDGLSTDDTRSQVMAMQQADPRIALLDNPQQTAPHAMNIGLAQARGEVIVRVDGHCTLAPDYLSQCVRLLQHTGAACVGGPLTSQGEGWWAQAIALAMSSPFGVGNARFRYADTPGYVDTLAFGAYRREVFDTIGHFNPELTRNQDDEFNYRLRQAGFQLYLSPEIRSVYYTRSSLKKLWSQYFQYGFWKIRVIRDYPGSVQARHLVPGLFVLGLAASLLGALSHRRLRPLPLAILLPYTLASLVFGLRRTRARRAYLPGVLSAFPVLHTAYGTGFWWGLLAALRSAPSERP